jgi:hypothetical protein
MTSDTPVWMQGLGQLSNPPSAHEAKLLYQLPIAHSGSVYGVRHGTITVGASPSINASSDQYGWTHHSSSVRWDSDEIVAGPDCDDAFCITCNVGATSVSPIA